MMAGMNGMMLPRCTMKMEKMADGLKCTMMCDDKTATEGQIATQSDEQSAP
jgi:hypothetical protein